MPHPARLFLAMPLAAVLVAPAAFAADALQARAKTAFAPLPKATASKAALVGLGRQLFFEPRLSASGQISCNSCHGLGSFGVDGQRTSKGHLGKLGGRNSPTVLNAGLHLAQFWDGRAKDLAEQAKGPILNPVEMAMPDAKAVERKLRAVPGYREAFARAFPGQQEPVTYDNLATAIAAFEATLVTPAPFDRYLAGDAKALSPAAKRGLGTFMDKGCVACHTGPAVGGTMYMKFGVVKPYQNPKDLGRFEVTKNPADKHVWKVPSLRNVTKTGPYFHDGGVKTIDRAVAVMGETQLGVKLTKAEVADVVSFLDALRGDVPAGWAKAPALPK
jgi:cytochrome c peroxidase